MRATAFWSRRAATRSSRRCSASSTSSSRSTRWTSSTGASERFEANPPGIQRLRREAAGEGHPLHPHVRAERRKRRRRAARSMPWFQGSPLLDHLETVHIASDRNLIDFRFPVQYVQRPDLDFRGYSGTDRVGRDPPRRPKSSRCRPARSSTVRAIVTYDGDVARSIRRHGGHADARRRDRRQPRRHARHAEQRARAGQRRRSDGGVDARRRARARQAATC